MATETIEPWRKAPLDERRVTGQLCCADHNHERTSSERRYRRHGGSPYKYQVSTPHPAPPTVSVGCCLCHHAFCTIFFFITFCSRKIYTLPIPYTLSQSYRLWYSALLLRIQNQARMQRKKIFPTTHNLIKHCCGSVNISFGSGRPISYGSGRFQIWNRILPKNFCGH